MQLFEISYAYKFLGGFYLALSVLHIILFIYNRNRKASLIYSSGLLLVFINFTFTQQVESWSGAHKLNILTDLGANGVLLFYISNFVLSKSLPQLKKVSRIFGWLYLAGITLLILNFYSDYFNIIQLILRTAIYTMIGVNCILGLIKKIANFHLIVLATLFLMIMWVFFGTDLFGFWGNDFPFLRVLCILIGFITPFIAYSYYLARYLSKTKKNLAREHIINEQLSLINLQAEKIKDLDQLKSRFFANISHEFRTPLTLLLGPIEKRLNNANDSNDKIELSSMHRNASRMLTLINQLLDLSRLEAGTMKLKYRNTDLESLIVSIMSQFSSMADAKEIHFELVATKPVALYVDQEKMEKIISNLLSNAFKFTPAGGHIIITISQNDSDESFKNGYAEISIEDTGLGIESEHLSKIFDRFYQVDMSSTRAYEGSGIGLSLTKELVEMHQGTISVTSDAGKGSKFIVKLPLGDSHLISPEFDMLAEDMINPKINGVVHSSSLEAVVLDNNIQSLPRLLIVEDNADLRYYLKNNLKVQFTISETENGEEGIAAAIEEIPDIIISDLMMPKINGLQLCQQLKEDEKTNHIPIILLTAKVDVETKLMGYRHGADDYIAKPFQIEELLVRIENLIANRKRIQEKFSRQVTLAPNVLPVNSMDERFLKRAMEVVEKSIADASFGVEPFAQQMGVSHTQLYRKIHAITGFNPNEFIRHMRLLRAADLMRQKAGNVAEITYQVGFNNLSYFSKVFKEKFGLTPTDFLRNPTEAVK
jgi:signal transduction histidine kinase/DNA-binding NarL/FixJ family response regulator